MSLSLLEAAKAAGLSKSALLKAIKTGRMSATRDEVTGNYRVDPAELFRVYSPSDENQQVSGSVVTSNQVLEEQVRGLERQVHQLEGERNDLRQRLDTESEERRRLTMMLTDQRINSHQDKTIPRTLVFIAFLMAIVIGLGVWSILKGAA